MPDVKRLDLLLQMQPTDTLADLDGVPCRLWQGVDEKGGQYLLYVHRAAPLDDAAAARMREVLAEQPAPGRQVVRPDVPRGID